SSIALVQSRLCTMRRATSSRSGSEWTAGIETAAQPAMTRATSEATAHRRSAAEIRLMSRPILEEKDDQARDHGDHDDGLDELAHVALRNRTLEIGVTLVLHPRELAARNLVHQVVARIRRPQHARARRIAQGQHALDQSLTLDLGAARQDVAADQTQVGDARRPELAFE